MSTQSPPERGRSPVEPPEPAEESRVPFLRRFLEFQLVFVVFLLIASIPEGPSPTSHLTPSMQVAIIGVLWVVSDAAALVARVVHILRRRPDR